MSSAFKLFLVSFFFISNSFGNFCHYSTRLIMESERFILPTTLKMATIKGEVKLSVKKSLEGYEYSFEILESEQMFFFKGIKLIENIYKQRFGQELSYSLAREAGSSEKHIILSLNVSGVDKEQAQRHLDIIEGFLTSINYSEEIKFFPIVKIEDFREKLMPDASRDDFYRLFESKLKSTVESLKKHKSFARFSEKQLEAFVFSSLAYTGKNEDKDALLDFIKAEFSITDLAKIKELSIIVHDTFIKEIGQRVQGQYIVESLKGSFEITVKDIESIGKKVMVSNEAIDKEIFTDVMMKLSEKYRENLSNQLDKDLGIKFSFQTVDEKSFFSIDLMKATDEMVKDYIKEVNTAFSGLKSFNKVSELSGEVINSISAVAKKKISRQYLQERLDKFLVMIELDKVFKDASPSTVMALLKSQLLNASDPNFARKSAKVLSKVFGFEKTRAYLLAVQNIMDEFYEILKLSPSDLRIVLYAFPEDLVNLFKSANFQSIRDFSEVTENELLDILNGNYADTEKFKSIMSEHGVKLAKSKLPEKKNKYWRLKKIRRFKRIRALQYKVEDSEMFSSEEAYLNSYYFGNVAVGPFSYMNKESYSLKKLEDSPTDQDVEYVGSGLDANWGKINISKDQLPDSHQTQEAWEESVVVDPIFQLDELVSIGLKGSNVPVNVTLSSMPFKRSIQDSFRAKGITYLNELLNLTEDELVNLPTMSADNYIDLISVLENYGYDITTRVPGGINLNRLSRPENSAIEKIRKRSADKDNK